MLKSCAYCGRIHDKNFRCRESRKARGRYERKENEAGRYTWAWRLKSEEIKERSAYLCAVCVKEKTLTHDELETHHIIKLTEAPELLLEDSNLICLCRRHHAMADDNLISEEYLRALVRERDERYEAGMGAPQV